VLYSSSYDLLHISSLPSLKDLHAWQQNGISYLLNVSGINIRDIYSDKDLEPFELAQTTFVDVFTKGTLIDIGVSLDTVSSETYLQLTTEEHQQAFLTAVQDLVEHLKKQISTCVFCHRGQGRSPLVVAAAAQQFYHESIEEAIARTRIIRPHSLFTDVSVSALQWCIEQPKS
jgi:hypothetical protein